MTAMFVWTIDDVVKWTLIGAMALIFGGLWLYIKFLEWRENRRHKKRRNNDNT